MDGIAHRHELPMMIWMDCVIALMRTVSSRQVRARKIERMILQMIEQRRAQTATASARHG